ncbi:unnamed protein product [Symbiodinium sp. CCMP2592]|nr:unnamed protein product [Symbiodinium sp. CCMP2592]
MHHDDKGQVGRCQVRSGVKVFVCNDYVFTDALKQLQDHRSGFISYLTHEEFLDVTAPMFPKDTEDPHKMVVLKRSNILVSAGKCLLLRRFTQEEITVPCLSMGASAEFLKPSSGDRYQQYRDTNVSMHPNFHRHVQWEADYVNAILNGKSPPRPGITIRNSTIIDLDGPPPKVSRRNSAIDVHSGEILAEKMDRLAETEEDLSHATDREILKILIEDRVLPDLKGAACPHWQHGKLSVLTTNGRDDILRYRCNRQGCQRYFLPQHLHPIFTATKGPEGIHYKFKRLHYYSAMSSKKKIKFGGCPRAWTEVEADEATVDKNTLTPEEDMHDDGKPVLWEQWGASVQRGNPQSQTLVLPKLNPAMTVPKAPGPGPSGRPIGSHLPADSS